MKVRLILFLLSITTAMFCGVSCKTMQAVPGASLQSEQTLYCYTIALKLDDNGIAMNGVMDKLQQLVFIKRIEVANSSFVFDNIKQMQVTTGEMPQSRIEKVWMELYKTAGVIAVSVSKN